MKIRKAVFPVANFGKRFFPATNAMSKELLSTVDKPNATDAQSNLASIGRYVLAIDIYGNLRGLFPDIRDEMQLTDTIK